MLYINCVLGRQNQVKSYLLSGYRNVILSAPFMQPNFVVIGRKKIEGGEGRKS